MVALDGGQRPGIPPHPAGAVRRHGDDPLPGRVGGRTDRHPLFITRVTGLAEQDNESFGAQTLDAALEEHERIVQKLLRQLTGR